MANRCPHQIVLCIAALWILSSCVNQPSALEIAKSSQCHDDSALDANHQMLTDIQQFYCTPVLSNLAPQAPKGIKPQWARDNPYPALPDYYLYPDTSPMQINARRLQRVASCMHKRCLTLTQDPKNYCSDPDCVQNKGHTMIATFLKLAQACTAEPYTQRRAVENVRKLYNARENKPIDLCVSHSRNHDIDLKLAFNKRVDACLPNQNLCPVDYACTPETVGYRCRPLNPLPPPDIPGIDFPSTAARQGLESQCQLSSECKDGLVCGIAHGAYSRCALPCDAESKCPKLHHCYMGSATIPFCTGSCNPTSKETKSPPKNQKRTCIPDQQSGRYLDITPARLTEMITSDKPQDPNLRIETVIQEFDTSATCGNGVVDPPEQCDLGATNGEPKLGAWCTTSCTTAECGNNIREPGEACECTIDYERAFAKNEELSRIYQVSTTCPGRHALTDGSEKALGFACHSCTIVHGRHMRDTRQNPHFLPEFDPFNPPDKSPESGAKLPE